MSANVGQIGRVGKAFQEVAELAVKAGSVQGLLDFVHSVPQGEIPIAFRQRIAFLLGIQDAPPGAAGITDQVQEFWGQEEIDIMGIKTPIGAQGMVSAYSDFSRGQALSADLLLLGVGVNIRGPDYRYRLRGGATASKDKLASPDAWTLEDLTNGALAPDFLNAELDVGGCAWDAAEDFCDGFNLKFTVADRVNIIDDPVKEIASCGEKRHGFGMSSSEIIVARDVSQVNALYNGLPSGNPFNGRQFIATNLERDGLVTVNQNIVSSFKPSRVGEAAKASFGLMSNHPLYTNPGWRFMSMPVLMEGGKPFRFVFRPAQKAYVQRLFNDLGTTERGFYAPDGALTAAGPIGFTEWNPRTQANVARTESNKILKYKFAPLELEICFRGFSLIDQELATALGGAIRKSAGQIVTCGG